MPFKIVRDDITKMTVDAIVNAANEDLMPGGGVCGAIFAAAGFDKLAAACAKLGHCDTGSAVITKGYNLKSKYIIHTPGPVYRDGKSGEETLLYSCYKSSLELARRCGCGSIAFPLISSGIYGYPKQAALRVAANAVMDFLEADDMEIYLVVYDKRAFEISSKLFSDVTEYIDEHLVVEEDPECRRFEQNRYHPVSMPRAEEYREPVFNSAKADSIADRLNDMDLSFSEYLLKLIDASGLTDSQVYKKANIDRRLFSKIRGNPRYKPGKTTAAAFAIALELDEAAARTLIEKAGYSLTRCSKFDIIIQYFIEHKNYNIFEINEVLFTFDQPLIGA